MTRDGSKRRSARVVRRSASTPTLPRPMATSAGHSSRSANWTRRSPLFVKSLRLEPGGSLAARHLADACYRKVVVGLLSIHKWIDAHIVRLRNQRPFLPISSRPKEPSHATTSLRSETAGRQCPRRSGPRPEASRGTTSPASTSRARPPRVALTSTTRARSRVTSWTPTV